MIDDRPRAEDLPMAEDMERAAHYLRAGMLAREWLTTQAHLEPNERILMFRSYILGYFAAIKDRT